MRTASLLACASIAMFGCVTRDVEIQAPGLPAFAGMFAFADTSGTLLLALEPIADVGAIRGAICEEGRIVRVRHLRRQERDSASTHRQSAENFALEPGDVYQIDNAATTRGASCFLTGDSLLRADHTPLTPAERRACTPTESGALASVAGRGTEQCWRVAAGTDGLWLFVAQFVRQDTSALAGLALVRDSVELFYPLTGTYRGDDQSVWRVDDGGVFDPDALRVLFAAKLLRGYAMAFAWMGAEGELAQLVASDSSVRARMVVSDYRYLAPR